MELLLEYMFFSTIEFAAGLCLMLAIFRFSLRDNMPHIIFTSLIIAQASFLTREVAQYPALAPIIQLLLMAILVWLMFRVQIAYAVIMVTISYIIMIVLQVSLYYIGLVIHFYSVEQFLQNRMYSNAIQIADSLVALVLSYTFYRTRIGFSFIPDNEKDRFSIQGVNLYLLVSVILTLFMLTVLYSFGFINPLLNVFFWIIILAALLYLAVKKERLE